MRISFCQRFVHVRFCAKHCNIFRKHTYGNSNLLYLTMRTEGDNKQKQEKMKMKIEV